MCARVCCAAPVIQTQSPAQQIQNQSDRTQTQSATPQDQSQAPAVLLRPSITNQGGRDSTNDKSLAPLNTVPTTGVTTGVTTGATTTSKEPVKLETFFQLSPSAGSDKSSHFNSIDDLKARSTVDSALAPNSQQHTKSTSNFLWHLLDNIGVPISKGNHDPSIDPRINGKMSIPPYRNTASLSSDAAKQESPFAPPGQSTPPTVHKIPESELQGLDPILQNDERAK